jgi:hypothetical protein
MARSIIEMTKLITIIVDKSVKLLSVIVVTTCYIKERGLPLHILGNTGVLINP